MGQLSTFIYFESNKTKMQNSPFMSRQDFIEQDFDLISEIQGLHRLMEQDGLSLFDNISPTLHFQHLLSRLHKINWLDAEDINALLCLAETFLQLQRLDLKSWKHHKIYRHDNQDSVTFRRKVLQPLRKFISPEGEVDYSKHPTLKPIYFKVQQKKSSLRQQVSLLLKEYSSRGILQSDQYDIINGHYVIAVRSDSYQSNIGVIMAHSQSNLTLYVEPNSLRQINYELLELQSELEKELYKILQQTTELLREHHRFFKNASRQVHHFDLMNAKAKYAYHYNLTRPHIAEDDSFEVDHFFHPLINNPVTNSISLHSQENGMVISGPNTGGKTVSLKSIALCALFAHAGMFVPAQHASLPLFDGIYFFANDQQNILEGLSSFAAETSNYLNLINSVASKSIIFIDEVFNSTSSEEASALALAVIDKILEISNSKIFISTHHYSFKTLIQMNKNFINAHVGMDPAQNTPTYKLHLGTPGSSMALQIFQKIGKENQIVSQIIKNAEKYLSADQIKYEKLLDKLSTQEGILHQERRQLEQLKKELMQQKQSNLSLLKLEKEQMIHDYEVKLNTILKEANTLLKKVKKGEILSPKTFLSKESELKRSLQNEKEAKTDVQPLIPRKQAAQLEVGKKYYCSKNDTLVTVQSLNLKRNQVKVTHKNFSFVCKPTELFYDKNTFIHKDQQTIEGAYQLEDIPNIEVKCLGMRLEEFQETVEQYLTALQLEQIPYAIITHGHGDGVLKNWLRKTIDQRKVFRWSNIDGNDGQTRIELNVK